MPAACSGAFDKFRAAGRTGDLYLSFSSRHTDLLPALRTAIDLVRFRIAYDTFIPFAETEQSVLRFHIHPFFFAAFFDIFRKHPEIQTKQ